MLLHVQTLATVASWRQCQCRKKAFTTQLDKKSLIEFNIFNSCNFCMFASFMIGIWSYDHEHCHGRWHQEEGLVIMCSWIQGSVQGVWVSVRPELIAHHCSHHCLLMSYRLTPLEKLRMGDRSALTCLASIQHTSPILGSIESFSLQHISVT